MTIHLNSLNIMCPYCGEVLEILVDTSGGDQDYIEDCQVCCSPIELTVHIDSDGQISDIIPQRDSD